MNETNADKNLLLSDLHATGVPPHLHGGLVRYVLQGITPGGFLVAVLSNNLAESFGRADEASRAGLFNVVSFVYNHIPDMAWGSLDRVREWCERGGLEGQATP